MALAQHIMMRLADGRVIAPTAEARLVLARSALTIGEEYDLLALRGSDSHIHVGAACTEPAAYQLGRRVELSLSRRLALPVPFERARVKPVKCQHHLSKLFDYILRQEQHHNTGLDPLFTASNLPDLLGARALGAYTIANVERLLPRVTRAQLLDHLGCDGLDDEPMDLVDLPEAAADALAIPHLRGKSREATAARRAAVAVACDQVPVSHVADLLQLSPRTVRQLRSQAANEAHVRAVQLQLRMRGAARRQRLLSGQLRARPRTTPASG